MSAYASASAGKYALWNQDSRGRYFGAKIPTILDGTSNTFMVVEIAGHDQLYENEGVSLATSGAAYGNNDNGWSDVAMIIEFTGYTLNPNASGASRGTRPVLVPSIAPLS